jgi:hypothetical protein
MELNIEPVSRTSWPLYRSALDRLKVPRHKSPVPMRRGLMLVRSLRTDVASGKPSREVIGGALLVPLSSDILVVMLPFRKPFVKPELDAEVAEWMGRLGTTLSSLAYFDGRTPLGLPNSELGARALAEMGFTSPVPLLGRPAQ